MDSKDSREHFEPKVLHQSASLHPHFFGDVCFPHFDFYQYAQDWGAGRLECRFADSYALQIAERQQLGFETQTHWGQLERMRIE
jgi:hypothetical protein